MAKKSFTVYLAKADYNAFDELLSESGQERLAYPSTKILDVNDYGDGGRLYIFVGGNHPPKWLAELRTVFAIPGQIETKSSCAILSFQVGDRLFAATFAHGWMFLDESKFESDFGLRVALNALDETKLKRLERANLGDALRGVSLSPFQRDFSSFGLDNALDLVRKVSGATRNQASADALTGAKSLKITGEYSLGELPEMASEAFEFFSSDHYKTTDFSIIDFVQPIADRPLIRLLDDLAVDSIKNGQEQFELGLPVALEDEGVAYKFHGPGLRKSYPDLLLRNYTASLGQRLPNIDSQTIRDHKIGALFDDGDRPERKWPIRSALVGSLVHNGGRYAINEGEWYRIDEAFKNNIEQYYNGLVLDWDNDAPRPLRRLYDKDGNGKLEKEEDYNAYLSEARGYVLLDKTQVTIPGVPRSGFEPCDVLDLDGKRFIHVKKSSRRSTILSHFFKQGSNSAQQFGRFPATWQQLGLKVRELMGADAEMRLRVACEDETRKWRVEYWIADTPRANGQFNIPFFSKISVRDEVTNLLAMGYEVSIRFIHQQPEHV